VRERYLSRMCDALSAELATQGGIWKTTGVKRPEEALVPLPPIRVAPGPAFVSRRPPSRFPPAADAEDVSAPRWARVWILSADVGNQV
jgi:hypothetical protein